MCLCSLRKSDLSTNSSIDISYMQVLQSFHLLLQEVEEELGRDGRVGSWLGGGLAPRCYHQLQSVAISLKPNKPFSVADITLGLYLHRLWQLGMEGEYFEDGVRPHLSVFYKMIRERPSFLKVTRLVD